MKKNYGSDHYAVQDGSYVSETDSTLCQIKVFQQHFVMLLFGFQ